MGAGGSSWLQRKIKRTVHAKVVSVVPANVVNTVTTVSQKAKQITGQTRATIQGAVAEGRSAARDRESQLRRDLDAKRRRR